MTRSQLRDKTAIVTGGGRGIGRAIAVGFAAEGARVCVLARSRGEIEQVADEISDAGGEALAVVCDVTDRIAVDEAIDSACGELGGLDILVNNAGGWTERNPVGEDDPERWAQVVRVHLDGSYYCTRAALPHLKRRGGGAVIMVGSGMGHQAQEGNSSYNAAKAGLWMLTRCLALELRAHRIAVNELVPGLVRTSPVLEAIDEKGRPTNPQLAHEWLKEPEDVVPLALFLACQPPTGPTGQSFSLARRPF